MKTWRALVVTITLIAGCSQDRAGSVEVLQSPAGKNSAQAHLANTVNGTPVLSWLESVGSRTALKYASLEGNQWSTTTTVAEGDNWLVNWADFPSVAPLTPDLWAAHWLKHTADESYAYDVVLSLSTNGGETWSAPVTPHQDQTATEHGFVSLFPVDNKVGAIWLDGRNMPTPADQPPGPMTLRSAHIDSNLQVSNDEQIDAMVCDCCQTDVAITTNGPVAVYRNRDAEEVRDIYVARMREGAWQPAAVVADDNWHINGCPVNGPAIDANDNNVAVAWFTAASGLSRVRLAHSADGATTFSSPIDIDAERAIGRVDVVSLDNGDVAVSWLRRGLQSPGEICVRRVSQSGEMGPVEVIAKTIGTRPSGFPQMVRDSKHLVFAWTNVAKGQVETARLPLSDLKPQ